jgi:predicted permease
MTEMQPPVVRLFAAILRRLPHTIPADDREQMLSIFATLEGDARDARGRRGSIAVLIAELPGLMVLAADGYRHAWRMRGTPLRAAHDSIPNRSPDMIDALRHDIRYAIRALLRMPGFAAVAILSLALGIGANTAIFSVVNAVLLQPLAFADPDRLIGIGEGVDGAPPGQQNSTSPGTFFDLKAQTKAFSGMAAFTGTQGALVGRGEPEMLQGFATVGGMFDVLGVRPLLGRTPTLADESPDAEAVVVLSHETWTRFFGTDRDVVGKSINLAGASATIIGVMPESFRFPDGSAQYWVAWRMKPEFRANRDQYQLGIVARLRPGVSLDAATAELAVVASRLRSDWAQYNTGLRLDAVPLRDAIIGSAQRPLYLLMGAVGLVLLIACANIGNLLLARATGRRREFAVRQALGAGSGRITRQLLTESVLLAMLGGIAGVFLGRWLLSVLVTSSTVGLPRIEEIGLDGRVLLFTLTISVLAGIAFGMLPAKRLSSARATDALRAGNRAAGGDRWTRGALVVSELALAVVLLAGAGLLLRSFALLQRVDPGFATERLLTFTVSTRNGTPAFFDESLARIRALPGVRDAAIISQLPVSGRGIGAWFNMYDRPVGTNETPPAVAYRVASSEYFSTTGIPLRRGRLTTVEDRLDNHPSVLVNEALARQYWPDGDPIGRDIYLGAPDNRIFPRGTIVGIVGDTKDAGLSADALPTVFIPTGMMPTWRFFSYIIRTEVDPATLSAPVRAEIRALDASIPIRNMQTMDQILSSAVGPARWSMTLLGLFAAMALVLAGVGIFGVLSFTVAQRTRELGIRMALGAAPRTLRLMVLAQGMGLAITGVVLGLGGALALTRLMSSMVYGVRTTDPLTYVGVAVVLVGVGAVASYLPARRATEVSPLVALRSE